MSLFWRLAKERVVARIKPEKFRRIDRTGYHSTNGEAVIKPCIVLQGRPTTHVKGGGG